MGCVAGTMAEELPRGGRWQVQWGGLTGGYAVFVVDFAYLLWLWR